MNTASLAIQSVVKEPGRHALNAGAGAAGVTVAPDYLAITVGVVSILVGLLIACKTYKEIVLLNREITAKDRRKKQEQDS